MEMPVIVVPYCVSGIQDFIQNLDFECVVLIDEAEKTFKDTDNMMGSEILLKLIDGVYNRSRKLYILTTNRLTINENLIGRPGRIKYIHEFGNLSEKAVNDFIDDNLIEKYKDKKPDILKMVDLLEISTIDILRSIVDEVNIHGGIDSKTDLNIPRANYVFNILQFRYMSKDEETKIMNILTPHLGDDLSEWLSKKYTGEFTVSASHKDKDVFQSSNDDDNTNLDVINDSILDDGYLNKTTMTSKISQLCRGDMTNIGTIITKPDDSGIFKLKPNYGDTTQTCILLGKSESPSLYSGSLIY